MKAKVAKRAYLDTNVLIDYAWERTPSASTSRSNLASNLIKLGLEGRFDIYISVFCIMELYEHFRDWFLLQKVIGDGFGYREFRRERKRHRLTKKEVAILESLVAEFRDNLNIYFVEFETVPDDFFARVATLQKNGMDCLDAFHLLTALDVGATHFITKDGEVRSRFDKVTRRELVSPPMEMTSMRGFLRGLRS
jgi:predicted nucleic acid-binding protein